MISLDAVAKPDADGLLCLPALSALAQDGVFCRHVSTMYPTITYPIHTTLLTGCRPALHGIGHNQPFQPGKAPEMRAWYWDVREIRVKTLHQAAFEKGLDVASILWPVSGKNRAVRRNFPEVLPLPGESPALKMMGYGSPLWVLRMEMLHGRTRKSIRQPDLDDYATLLCEQLYASRRPPDVLTVHLTDCDAMRHQYGRNSKEAGAAMSRLDGRVERIVSAVRKAGLEEETLFCIVSDHGHRDTTRGIPLDRLLQEKCSARAQSLGMGAYIFAQNLSKARQALEENSEAWGIDGILDEEALRALGAPKEVHLAVNARRGCRFTDEEEEGLCGEHGFSLDDPEAEVLLWLRGPGIRHGVRLNKAGIVDVAPTLAHALDLSLPDAEGGVLWNALENDF